MRQGRAPPAACSWNPGERRTASSADTTSASGSWPPFPATRATSFRRGSRCRPDGVRNAADRAGLGTRDRIRRHNRAFRRQGEWFFGPCFRPARGSQARVEKRTDPARTRAEPRLAAGVVRSGGERVLICNRHPNGVSETEYRQILATTPGAARLGLAAARPRRPRFTQGVPCVTATTPRSRCTTGTESL